MSQLLHYQSLALRWGRAPHECAIDGGVIPERRFGVDPLLVDSLTSTNTDMYIAVAKSICENSDVMPKFVELANIALSCRVDELISVLPLDMPDREIETWATAAHSLNEELAGISCGRFDTRYEWPKALKRIADECGGSDAALASLALIGVALAARLIQVRRFQPAWMAATEARKIASIVCARLIPAKTAISKMAKTGAEAKHAGPSGKRSAKAKIREIWSSGKYSSRDLCAEEECAALDISFSTARKALRGTPDPT